MTFLDTHVVVWLYQRDRSRFSDLAQEILDRDQLYVSAVVALELEYLFEIGRLTERSAPVIGYLDRSIGLKTDDCSLPRLIEFSLDMSWTRDPFDRLITANAELHSAILLTKDESIRKHYRHSRW